MFVPSLSCGKMIIWGIWTLKGRRFSHRMRANADREKAELRAELEAQMAKQLEAQRNETRALQVMSCVSEAQLEALQTRLDALHQATLLTDAELEMLEDKVADFIECRSSLTVALGEVGAAAAEMKKLVGLCEGVAKDKMLARQLRRKLL
eukprot:COSAG06_NODE_4390_length_4307_cov_3.484553_8_plen_150_part_00